MEPINPKYKAGYVAIVGEPNVGKSTLLNALLEQKISIVTNKPQTTRQRVLGILSRDDVQIIFLDTPGLLKPKYLLHKEMVKSAESALADADVILVMTQASRGTELPAEVSERVVPISKTKPIILVINKADTINKTELLPVIESFAQQDCFKEIIPVSALHHDNLDAILKSLVHYLPEHEAFYPPDIVSESPERFFVAELIREQLFEKFSEEIPYSTAVEIREFKERETGKTLISADIIVERESQKGIIIGKRGEALKSVGTSARFQIEEFLQRPVFLELHVKVREKWRESEAMMRQLGYHSKK
ncbi:MAG: GTPase Era [Ignavibacteriae bacterium]|nr:MAG: GTPase Era [Ignavibacteriota bacterium]